ncbi:MAG: hypothetical protein FWG15_02615 [Propionibacteriaceae bacterium]|nr:hypothetical protein [Propionibacteriaceae bacterium]
MGLLDSVSDLPGNGTKKYYAMAALGLCFFARLTSMLGVISGPCDFAQGDKVSEHHPSTG